MKTMKKFLRYFILFILLFLWVSGLMYVGTRRNVKKSEIKQTSIIAYEVQNNSPIIEVTQCKDGQLKGTITNDTKVLINVIYVKAEGYDLNNNLLETQYSEIKYFNVGEKAKFEIDFKNKDVEKIKISSVEAKIQ